MSRYKNISDIPSHWIGEWDGSLPEESTKPVEPKAPRQEEGERSKASTSPPQTTQPPVNRRDEQQVTQSKGDSAQGKQESTKASLLPDSKDKAKALPYPPPALGPGWSCEIEQEFKPHIHAPDKKFIDGKPMISLQVKDVMK